MPILLEPSLPLLHIYPFAFFLVLFFGEYARAIEFIFSPSFFVFFFFTSSIYSRSSFSATAIGLLPAKKIAGIEKSQSIESSRRRDGAGINGITTRHMHTHTHIHARALNRAGNEIGVCASARAREFVRG